MTRKPLDFEKIEALRKHMLISVGDWASILGVSRMTYYKWVVGKAVVRERKDSFVRQKLRELLAVTANGWPTPDIKGLDRAARAARLLAQLGRT